MHHIVAETKKEYKSNFELFCFSKVERRKNADFHNRRFGICGILVQNFYRTLGRICSRITVTRVSSSSWVVSRQRETRKVLSMTSGATFMAVST